MDKIRVSAKTKDEAITKALIELGTTSDRLKYDVLVQGSKGLFGIGAKPWIIEACLGEAPKDIEKLEREVEHISSTQITEIRTEKKTEKTAERAEVTRREEKSGRQEHRREKSERAEHFSQNDRNREPKRIFSRGGYDPREAVIPIEVQKPLFRREIKRISTEEAEKAKEDALSFLNSMLSGMKMEVSVSSEFHHESNELLINLEGPDMGILIGKRGQTLDSLQYLTSLVVNREHHEDHVRVKIDTEDYRKRREQTLRTLARNISYKVRRNRKPVALEPMNPYERRIIHAALQNDKFCSTRSDGDEPFRHVVVFLKNDMQRSGSERRSGRYNSHPRRSLTQREFYEVSADDRENRTDTIPAMKAVDVSGEISGSGVEV